MWLVSLKCGDTKTMRAISTLLLAFACCTLAQTVPSSARTELEKGVQAYNQAKYDDAVEHLRNAVDLDPELVSARLYLATAYAQQYVPGLNSPTNLQIAQAAISSYAHVLEHNPTRDQKLTGLRALAQLSLGMKKFETAKDYRRDIIRIASRDPEPYFSLAIIDWTQA